MVIEIEVESETGFLIAIEGFIYKCSEEIIPKECDREQLVQNIGALHHDMKLRKHWIQKGIGIKEADENERRKG